MMIASSPLEEPCHRSVQHIRDKQRGAAAAPRVRPILYRHIPRTIDQVSIDCLLYMAPRVEYQQTTGLRCCRGTICRGQTSDNHPAAAQYRERSRQTQSTGAWPGKSRGVNLREQAEGTARRYLDERGPGSLKV